MTIDVRMELIGARSIERMLAGWKPSSRRRIVRSGVDKSSRIVSRAAKNRAPVESGLLRKSIGVRVRTYKNGSVVGVVGPRKGFRREVAKSNGRWTSSKRGIVKARANPVARLEVRDPVKYAHLVEMGTKPHSLGQGSSLRRKTQTPGIRHPGARAKPFLEPAFRSSVPRMRQIMAAEIQKNVRKEARRLVRRRGLAA